MVSPAFTYISSGCARGRSDQRRSFVLFLLSYRKSKKDKPFLRCFVALLFAVDTTNTFILCATLFQYTIDSFGDDYYFLRPTVGLLSPVFTALTSYLAQLFFAWRIRVLLVEKHFLRYAVPLLVAMIGATSLAGAGWLVHGIHQSYYYIRHYKGAVVLWLVATMITDAVVAITLVTILRRSRTGYAQTVRRVEGDQCEAHSRLLLHPAGRHYQADHHVHSPDRRGGHDIIHRRSTS